MKTYSAAVKVTLRKGILDVQGKTVEQALHAIEFTAIERVRIGKFVEFDITAESEQEAKIMAEDACRKLIANPIMEDFSITLSEREQI
ncbi:phosphoribosylformylglycinamidine synthase subunit PurS [Ignavibacteria bacterium]|jgi:phosphoribosylformylglycinamidine synthase|nr:phosphoribosylformylglycinamidine synthase subunit PurS [Bacteroidota bacterium]MCZ2131636.1 phosphoribosylformylglycinamidine synthase subunit PurS [Bacteroidota bacterium]